MKPATMEDVAMAAGVSAKTVSRVVNREPGVRPATLAHVDAAIATLRYRRNDVARNLRKGIATATIGLLIEDLANPFYATLAKVVERVADRHGHALTIMSSDEDPARERELLTGLLRRGTGGLLIVPASQDHRYLDDGLVRGTPLVFLDRPPVGIAADAVVLDNVGGARRATQHLLAQGHQRIAYVGDSLSVVTSAERLQGYREALQSAGVPVDDLLIRTSPARADTSEAATRLLMRLPAPPTALFAQNNRNCLGVIRALRSSGIRCAIVGFDDFELADMLVDPITVIGHGPGEMGRTGAELLFARIAGDSRPPQRIVLPTRLIVRGSGELPP